MTDKEFKRLSRSQLIEIIYQFQLKQDELIAENQRLSEELADKRLRITQAGNIAEAALAVNNVMQDAQNAAQQYLDEIRAMHGALETECAAIRQKAMEEAAEILAHARKEAAAMRVRPRKEAVPTPQKVEQKEAAPVPQKAEQEKAAPPEAVKEQEPVTPPRADVERQKDALLEEILVEFGSLSEL